MGAGIPLGGDELKDAFGELAVRLKQRGVQARLYVVGGAAMALVYDESRFTRDVDAAIEAGWDEVHSAAREMAANRGWPSSWLNEQATAYMPSPNERYGSIVFEHANLTVTAASADHMLAMKARSARRSDEADFRRLLGLTGLRTASDVIELAERSLPGAPLGPRQTRWIEEQTARASGETAAAQPQRTSPQPPTHRGG